MSRPPHVLYYSRCCRYCKTLTDQLFANRALADSFQFVDAARLPKTMFVPTIVTGNKSYVGRDAFAWLQRATATGPACYDVNDTCGIEYTNIGGSSTIRSTAYCDLAESGCSPMTAIAAGPQAQMMDARVARLIRARQAQVPGPCARVG